MQNNPAAGSQGVVTTPLASHLRPRQPPRAGAGHSRDRGELSPRPHVPKPRAEPGREGLLPRSAPFTPLLCSPTPCTREGAGGVSTLPRFWGSSDLLGLGERLRRGHSASCSFYLGIQTPQPAWLSSSLILSPSLLPPGARRSRTTTYRQAPAAGMLPFPHSCGIYQKESGKKKNLVQGVLSGEEEGARLGLGTSVGTLQHKIT